MARDTRVEDMARATDRIINTYTDRITSMIGEDELPRFRRILTRVFKMIQEENKETPDSFSDDSSFIQSSAIVNFSVAQMHYYLITEQNIDSISDDNIAKKIKNTLHIIYKSEMNSSDLDDLGLDDARVTTLYIAESYLEQINRPLARTNPSFSLVNDIFETIFRKTSGFCRMLPLGLYSDAFVSWRTLHESECIIKLLITGGDTTRYSYIKHITYNNAYRNQSSFSKEELDMIFAKLKGEMSAHGLKSKDMKKFIEYGWLYDHPNYDPNDPAIKLNFRDGIERLAGLSEYSKVYEGASEIAHSSSAFFYSNDNFCRDLSLAMTYRSFIRIGDLFLEYMSNYFKIHKQAYNAVIGYLSDVKRMSAVLDHDADIEEVMKADE